MAERDPSLPEPPLFLFYFIFSFNSTQKGLNNTSGGGLLLLQSSLLFQKQHFLLLFFFWSTRARGFRSGTHTPLFPFCIPCEELCLSAFRSLFICYFFTLFFFPFFSMLLLLFESIRVSSLVFFLPSSGRVAICRFFFEWFGHIPSIFLVVL